MIRIRWVIHSFTKYFRTFFLIIFIFFLILTTYVFKNLLTNFENKYSINTVSDNFIHNPQDKMTTISVHRLFNDAEYRKKIFERKIERLSQRVAKKPRVISFNNKTVLKPNYHVHIFYYAWYGNLKQDNGYSHWNHEYIPNWKPDNHKSYPKGRHKAPMDIGSNYYPMLDCYSSRDPYAVETHMKEMRSSGVGVIVVSWSPPGMKDSPHDILPLLFYFANLYDLKITLHIEPYLNRNPINLRKHLTIFFEAYKNHPALYKVKKFPRSTPVPVLYIYDSYLTPIVAWRELLSKRGNLSVRGTNIDALYIGLLVDIHHRYHIKKSHFDGFYTYFASNGFSYGSSWKNWIYLAKFARQNDLMFIPSVGPGYVDTRVRPWNNANTRLRRHGQYYDVAWRSAISCNVKFISITSFNEWHEGTQIEPAKSFSYPGYTYLDYEPEGSNFYLNLTKWWVTEFSKV